MCEKVMTKTETLKRYTLFLVGLAIASMGVAFSTKAGLGTSPVASVPFSASLVNGFFSFGGWLNVLSVIQILVQIIVSKGKCNYFEITVQTVLAFVYGYLTDMSVYLIHGINVEGYPMQFIFMALGCFILAFGIWLQFKGKVAMLPGEAMNRAISKTTKIRYENVKIFFDVLYITVSAVICFVFLGKLQGVREGSIIAAFAVGSIIKLYNKLFGKVVHSKTNC